MVVALALSASMAHAQSVKAVALERECKNWNGSIHRSVLQKTVDCQIYVKAWVDGMNAIGTYRFDRTATLGQTIKVFNLYIANHPEEENLPAGKVLLHSMTSSGLLISPGQGAGEASDH